MTLPKNVLSAKKKFEERLAEVQEFWEAHPKLQRQLLKLRKDYKAAVDKYKTAVRDYVTKNELSGWNDPDTGVKVSSVKPQVIVDLKALVDKVGWVVASKYLDKVVTYKVKDESSLERIVADGVLTMKEMNRYVEEKPSTPRVTIPVRLKDIL